MILTEFEEKIKKSLFNASNDFEFCLNKSVYRNYKSLQENKVKWMWNTDEEITFQGLWRFKVLLKSTC